MQQEETERGAQKVQSQFIRDVRSAAAWIDGFLSDERSTEEENRSWIALGMDSSIESGRGVDAGSFVRIHVVLPRTNERLRLVFLDEDDDPAPLDASGELTPVGAGAPASGSDLTMQYVLEQSRRAHLRFEGGIRFDGFEPDPYAGIRWRCAWSLEPWLLRATERVRDYADTGLESRTAFDLERLLSPDLFFRTTTHGEWLEEEAFEYGQRFLLYQMLGENQLWILDLDASAVTEPAHVLDEVLARFRFSQRFFDGRLLLELAPQIAWREEDDYTATPGLFVRIELAFGREN